MTDASPSPQGTSLVTKLKIGAAVIGVILLIIIFAQNTAAVETRFLFVTVTMPRVVLLMVTLAIGFVLGAISGAALMRGKRKS